ncbi:hypothetical protein KSP40_PGU011938 [Platanthera guangdongensis]|uniref:Biotin carboxyl carrier protein of acetyl-CoA carboxylase n=1 Tax=Platanthera guangdongensis TaxID=2320717 RepID=A0ABR2M3Q1_9ASPA
MASYIAIPCPKLPPLLRNSASSGVPMVPQARVSLQGCKEKKFSVLSAKTSEAIVEGSPNSSLPRETAKPSPKDKDVEGEEDSTIQTAVSDSEISAFMLEVSKLVKLVDSRDITELQLKRKDCELIIRKKEALQQPAPAAVIMQPPQGIFPTQSHVSHSAPAPSSPSPPAPTPVLPPPKGTSSSLPAFKSPMAGTFYRSPGPGEPPFVKVGDKVKKGQVVCIIEAMKLMNEIEADQSGTIVEIFAQDGKSVSLDTPLLIIGP